MRFAKRLLVLLTLVAAFGWLYSEPVALARSACTDECASQKDGCMVQADAAYTICDLDCQYQANYEVENCKAYNCWPGNFGCNQWCESLYADLYAPCINQYCGPSKDSDYQWCNYSHAACVDACGSN